MQKSISQLWSVLKSPRYFPKESHIRLYHYTNNEKKEKIVRSNEVVFRFSRVDKFLDKNEGRHILEPFYHACGLFYEESNGIKKQSFYELLASIGPKDLLKYYDKAWIICFSKNGNSSFLKRRYAAGDGWILGVSNSCLEGISINFPSEFGSINLQDVNYSFKRFAANIKRVLERCYLIFEKEEKEEFQSALRENIIQWLGEYSLIYKCSDYKQEEEIRLIYLQSEAFSSWEDVENGVRISIASDGHDEIVELMLDKKHLHRETQSLSIFLDARLNKTMLSSQEIGDVL